MLTPQSKNAIYTEESIMPQEAPRETRKEK